MPIIRTAPRSPARALLALRLPSARASCFDRTAIGDPRAPRGVCVREDLRQLAVERVGDPIVRPFPRGVRMFPTARRRLSESGHAAATVASPEAQEHEHRGACSEEAGQPRAQSATGSRRPRGRRGWRRLQRLRRIRPGSPRNATRSLRAGLGLFLQARSSGRVRMRPMAFWPGRPHRYAGSRVARRRLCESPRDAPDEDG